MPTPPIYYPEPPLHPAHPIPPVIWPSPPPTQPPAAGDEGGWAYSPIYGWVWVPSGGGGKPHPPTGEPPTATPA
jgi:hypothetical protein